MSEAVAEQTVETVIRTRLAQALGGWRGSLETALPTVAFVIWWVAREDLTGAIVASAVVVALAALGRLITGGTYRYVAAALFATALAAFFALRSGEAQDAFLPGILISLAYGVASLISILVRWPWVGFLVALGDPQSLNDPGAWRRQPGMIRVCSRLTWVLVGLFALRVAVMLPLYLAEEVAWLGLTKVVLGWPAYLVAIAIMASILVRGRTAWV